MANNQISGGSPSPVVEQRTFIDTKTYFQLYIDQPHNVLLLDPVLEEYWIPYIEFKYFKHHVVALYHKYNPAFCGNSGVSKIVPDNNGF
jgi:hypothetical protein